MRPAPSNPAKTILVTGFMTYSFPENRVIRWIRIRGRMNKMSRGQRHFTRDLVLHESTNLVLDLYVTRNFAPGQHLAQPGHKGTFQLDLRLLNPEGTVEQRLRLVVCQAVGVILLRVRDDNHRE